MEYSLLFRFLLPKLRMIGSIHLLLNFSFKSKINNLFSIYRVRGTLGSFIVLFCNLGILLGFILGAYCDYNMTPYVFISAIVLFVLLFFFFPESPSFLIKQNRLLVRNSNTSYVLHIIIIELVLNST